MHRRPAHTYIFLYSFALPAFFCGLVSLLDQSAYDAAARDVAAGLAKVEALLAASSDGGPYLLGQAVTELDVRLLPTAIRFDAV